MRQQVIAGTVAALAWLRVNTFLPGWLPARLRVPATGYVAAACGQCVATALTLALMSLFPGFAFPGALQLLVTVLVALAFGAAPSLLAALLGALLVNYVVLEPHFAPTLRTPTDVAGVLLHLAVGVAISLLPSQLARARSAAAVRSTQLQATFDAMGDAVILYDRERRMLEHNAALRRMFAFDRAPGFEALPIEERYARTGVYDLAGNLVPVEELPQMRALRGEALTGNEVLDLRMGTLDGRSIEVSVSASPVRDATGQIVGAVAVYRDVTERKRLERRTHEALDALLEMARSLVSADIAPDESATPAARASARRLAELTRSVLGCDRVAITAVDPETEATRPLAVVGLTPEQEAQLWATLPADTKLGDTVSPADIARLRAGEILTADLGEEGLDHPRNPYRARSVLVAPCLLASQLNGVLTVDYASAPHTYTAEEQALAEAASQLVALVIERERLLRERAAAEAQALGLREANRRMDEFMSLASHELRTPLTTIKANVQIAARRAARMASAASAQATATGDGDVRALAPDTEFVRTLLARVEAAVVRQERLVSDLLDVSRIEAGKLDLRALPLDLADLVRESVEEQRLAHAGRTITLRLPPQPIPVVADGDRVRQVIANYLTNALKYSAPDQPVEVRLGVEGGNARLDVRDHGPGIPASEQERIWDRFHRVAGIEHQSGSGVGLGLGLFISRDIIEQHGGRVGVTSAVGQGAEFWFTLPVAG